MKPETITFEKLLRLYYFYEALALYDAYYERASDLNPKYAPIGDALDMAWVPLVFHCTYFERLKRILKDGEIRPGKGKSYIALTELSITELTRFQSLRPKPFEVAIGFPRSLLESKGLFQPAYLKHSTQEVKERFREALPGYIELDDDLGALHEVRLPGSLSVDDAVWVLSSKRNETTKKFDLPELKLVSDRELPLSFWHPSHQEGLIREPVFRKVNKNAQGIIISLKCCGKYYLPGAENKVEKSINPPAGKPFSLHFPKELRTDTLKDGWEGPFSKYEMAAFLIEEIKRNYPSRISAVQQRIEI